MASIIIHGSSKSSHRQVFLFVFLFELRRSVMSCLVRQKWLRRIVAKKLCTTHIHIYSTIENIISQLHDRYLRQRRARWQCGGSWEETHVARLSYIKYMSYVANQQRARPERSPREFAMLNCGVDGSKSKSWDAPRIKWTTTERCATSSTLCVCDPTLKLLPTNNQYHQITTHHPPPLLCYYYSFVPFV